MSGLLSEITKPSSMRTIRVAYASASSGLCVTITTKRFLEISFKMSITCTLVSVSNAPVGSSAKMMSGLLTIARAIATRCICPPLISLGRLWYMFFSPTWSSASIARRRRSAFFTPESAKAISTFCKTVWWGIRL